MASWLVGGAAAIALAGCAPSANTSGSPLTVSSSAPTTIAAPAAPLPPAGTTEPPISAAPAPAAPNDLGAVPQPVAGGPAACDRSSYVNSNGQCVHRPEAASAPPSGATAQCKDGTYSFSKHRSGTCSSHGGVAVFF
ncbi:DUF3761 domain-containing protein [Nocardia terpenica]|nr:DUF3761 domain-containing protein [Nocardia terpenica]